MLPILTQYLESVENPRGMFRTLGQVCAVRDYMGRVAMCAGRSGAVFRIEADGGGYITDGGTLRLKCYFRTPRFARQICDYLETIQSPYLTWSKYLENEIYVYDHQGQGAWHDVMVSPWAEGQTLSGAVARAVRSGNRERLGLLAESFDALAAHILEAEWAHGDLKPENIVVAEDLSFRLIDYAGFFVPSLIGSQTEEIGTAAWQHPGRGTQMFDRHIDDYPAALISYSLYALARRPELYAKYNHGENIILAAGEIVAGRAPLWDELQAMWAVEGNARLYTLGRMLKNPTPAIDGLAELFTAASPSEGELRVVEKRGRWGFTAGGQVAIAPFWDEALGFSEGLAAVRLGCVWHFIDTAGSVTLSCPGCEMVKPFSEGLSAVRKDGLWGYVDRQGRMAVTPRFDRAGNFRYGIARVELNGNSFEINNQGNVLS